jgi:hypothetical protein
MTITTMSDFVAAVAAIGDAVTTVKRAYTYPPRSVSTADLPASFVRLPTGEEGALTLDGTGGWPTRRVDLVILVEPIEQNRPDINYDTVMSNLDALETQLRATGARVVAQSKPTWRIDVRIIELNQTQYWGIVASLEARG